MINKMNTLDDFEAGVSKALIKAAELVREEAIRVNTGILVAENGEVITISAEELKAQKIKNKN